MAGMKLYSLGSGDPGRLGPYRLLRRIATGGMGRIYLARQEAPGSPVSAAGPTGTVVDHGIVAVKTLLAEGFVSRPERERFAREVELAGRVDSAYTATVLDADPKAERPWLAIEFIPAPSLAELVVGAGTLPVDGVRWVAAGAARALIELHALGVVHRDIKPLNILLPHEGPRLIDFGISHAHDHTSSTTTIGTFAFTSPEQASGRKSTVASDMYSLGATLFFLAAGRAPYAQTDHSIGVLALVQRGETDTSGLPPELVPLILPLLDPDPERRPTPSDVLRDCLDGLDSVAADRGAGPWLPEEWTELIGEYAEQGRQLTDGALDLAAAEAPTEVRSESGHEGVDEALDEMREQLEALRLQRDALVREQAETEERERARQEEGERKRRERERKEEAERKERERKEQARLEREREEREREEKARKERELKEKQRKERERKKREREERERLAREKTATASKSAGTTTASKSATSGAATKPPVKKSQPMEGWGGLIVGALLIGLLIWQPWEKKDDDKPSSSPTPSYSQSLSGGGTDGLGGDSLGDDDSLGVGDSDTSSGSSGLSSGGSEPDPETTSPEPDPTEEAFKAVSYGDCLDVVDTGYGGQSTYDWSEETPNTTPCGIARVKVTSTTGDCEKRNDQTPWSYYSSSSGERTELCLTGEYHEGDCLLANRTGNQASVALLSSVNCTDRKVPSAFNDIFVITGIYSSSATCSSGQYDSNTYWSWKVGGGSTLLCTRAYD